MGITLIILNDKYNFTGRAQEQLSRFSKVLSTHLEKVCFAGGYSTMKIAQVLCGKKRLEIPEYIQRNIVNGTEEDLNRAIGFATINAAERIKTDAFDTIDPIYRGLSTNHHVSEAWLLERNLPQELLHPRFRELLTFIIDSKLYKQIQYYGHQMIFDFNSQDILININGVYQPSRYLLEHFRLENRSSRERAFIPPFIVCKATNQRYAYLQNGLTRHDSERDFRPYKILPLDQRPTRSQVVFKFCLNGNFDSPNGIKNIDFHSWSEVISPSGCCYSFGLFAQGVVQGPDPTEFTRRKIKSIVFDINNPSLIFRFVEQHRVAGSGRYHLSKYNCASFVREVCNLMNIPVSEKNVIRPLGQGFVNQIRLYAVASILASLIRLESSRSKIISAQEIASTVDVLNRIPLVGKKLVQQFSLDRSMESISLRRKMRDNPGMREWLVTAVPMLKDYGSSSDAQTITDFLNEVPISAIELKRLCQSLLKGSSRELTYKIFNLVSDIYTNHIDYEFSTPTVLYTNLYAHKNSSLR